MRYMSNKQIDKLNELLIDNGETLTSFYDETIDTGLGMGMRKGIVIGISISVVGGLILYGINKIKSKKSNTKNEE